MCIAEMLHNTMLDGDQISHMRYSSKTTCSLDAEGVFSAAHVRLTDTNEVGSIGQSFQPTRRFLATHSSNKPSVDSHTHTHTHARSTNCIIKHTHTWHSPFICYCEMSLSKVLHRQSTPSVSSPHMWSGNKINSVLATIYFISAPSVRRTCRAEIK